MNEWVIGGAVFNTSTVIALAVYILSEFKKSTEKTTAANAAAIAALAEKQQKSFDDLRSDINQLRLHRAEDHVAIGGLLSSHEALEERVNKALDDHKAQLAALRLGHDEVLRDMAFIRGQQEARKP